MREPTSSDYKIQPKNGIAITSLIMGILSLIPCLGILLGFLGLGFAMLARLSGNQGKVSMIGLILSLAGIALSIFYFIYILYTQ